LQIPVHAADDDYEVAARRGSGEGEGAAVVPDGVDQGAVLVAVSYAHVDQVV
jgi:hypothetical protein